MKILLADDEVSLRKAISRFLGENGHDVVCARDGVEALELWRSERPDVILLDIDMPRMNGFEACKAIRREDACVPVLFFTCHGTESYEIEGLRLGADDFLSKDVRDGVLLARLAAIERRVAGAQHGSFAFGSGQVDAAALRFRSGVGEAELSEREVALLRHLAQNRDCVIAKDALITRLWGRASLMTDITFNRALSRLRRKLGADGERIMTVHGQGIVYR